MTLLSQQLQQLSLPKDKVKAGAILHSSLIFSSRVASDYDIHHIYDIASNGLQELISLNLCFGRFKDSLFHHSSIKFERLIKTTDVLENIDGEIELFLALVSNYSLLSPAHKALEWLIRTYKIHLYNADALLTAFIPLHDCKIFAKLLEITTLPDNWTWLETAKSNHVTVSREELIKLCVSQPHYLVYLVENSLNIVRMTDNQCRIHHSFLVTLLYMVLDRFEKDAIPQDIVSKLYGCIVTTVSSDNKHLKAAGYIIVSQVARTITLKDNIVKELISVICSKAEPSLAKELVLTLCCILYHLPVDSIPNGAIERLLEDDYFLALQLVHTKSDISLFLGVVLNSMLQLAFSTTGLLLEDKLSALLELPDFYPSIATDLCNEYFQKYLSGDDSLRRSDVVKRLGDILATHFPDQMQEMFEKEYKGGCDMNILEGLKGLILSKYQGTETAVHFMEVYHALPGIRMLGLLKISEKLGSGCEVSEDERCDMVNSLITRLSDEDISVSLKSLALLQKVVAVADTDKVLRAVVGRIKSFTSHKSCKKEDVIQFIRTLVNFPVSSDLINTVTILLINTVPLFPDPGFKNEISNSVKIGLKTLGEVVTGSNWYTDICQYVVSLPGRFDLLRGLVTFPTPQNFVVACLLAISGSLNSEENSAVFGYFLGILKTAHQRKTEYKDVDITHNLVEVISTKAAKFSSNFDIMKREWEMVGLTTRVICHMLPLMTDPRDIHSLLAYLLHCSQSTKAIVAALHKHTAYTCAMEILLSGEPNNELLHKYDTPALERFLDIMKLVKITETDVEFAVPFLLCSLVSESSQVKSWSYKRLKTITKLGTAHGKVLNQLQLSKDVTMPLLQQEIKRVCSNRTPAIESWLNSVLIRSSADLPTLSDILYSVQHPTKLTFYLSLIADKEGAGKWTLGELTGETAALLDSPDLLYSALHSPKLISSVNSEFLSALHSSVSHHVIETLVGMCLKSTDEDWQQLVRQKLSEVSTELTLPVFLTLLKSGPDINVHILHILNMQGAASVELATTLFGLLDSGKVAGMEEDVIALLTTISNVLGAQTPATPSGLRSIVQVIRRTNTDTNRHTLHHNCLILLSKLALHFPSLVLDHVMSIFTFMGDSTMRMDDNYSIQVLLEAVSTIIPVLKKKKDILSILRVFCDTLPHIPSHRQQPIFSLLLKHTSSTCNLYYVFLLVVEMCSRERTLASQSSFFLQNLATHFPLVELLDTASALIKTLSTLPDTLTNMVGKVHKVTTDSGVDLQFADKKHYSYFKLGLATQLHLLSANKHFTGLLQQLDSEQNNRAKQEQQLAEVIEISLSILIHREVLSEADKFTELLSKRLSGVITSVTAGLPSKLFISVIKALLSTDTSLVHSKSLDILVAKLSGRDLDWTRELEDSLVELIDTLLKLSDKFSVSWKVLELIILRIGEKHPEKCEVVLTSGMKQMSGEDLRRCVSVCVEVLGVRVVPHLQELIPLVLKDVDTNREILRKIISTVPQFLSTHLPNMLTTLSLNFKEDNGCSLIGELVNIRVLLPRLVTSIDMIAASSQPSKLDGLTTTLTHCIKSSTTLKPQLAVLSNIFTKLLNYRDANTSTVDVEVEIKAIECFVQLVYKLTEKELLPLLLQLLEWSNASTERATTFYNLTTQLSLKLKGLFLLFGASIFTDIVNKLKEYTPLNQDGAVLKSKKVKKSDEREVLEHVLSTLCNMLKYDTAHTFTTPDRFDTLLPVLLNLLGSPSIHVTHLIPALSQLPIAANSDRLWKQFNFQLLNMSKSPHAQARLQVVSVYKEFVEKLGQDYSMLIPDSMPFLSELLEDSDTAVEEMTYAILKSIQHITGETLDQYL